MHELIETPPRLSGDEKNQINQLWQYLFRMSEVLNRNLENLSRDETTEQDQNEIRKQTGNISR